MPMYEHYCGRCDMVREVNYPLSDFDKNRHMLCPACKAETHRLVGGSTFILTGGGWAKDGYSKMGAYEGYKRSGHKVTLFDNKEDHDRVVEGEAREIEKKKLKRLDRLSKKHFGPDAGVKQKEADRKIEKAGKDRLK